MAEEKARDPTKPEIKPVNIPLAKIHDLPGSVFAPPSPKSLEALTSSIVLRGVQEPVILRQREDGEFQIVSGNRRRKASELAKKTEIPAFIYDMTEKEARDFRLRGNAKGTPPGKLLPESEIGKNRKRLHLRKRLTQTAKLRSCHRNRQTRPLMQNLRQRRRRRNRKKSRKRFRLWKMRMQTVKNRIYLRNRLKSQPR